MKREYRIVQRGESFYPQTRHKRFLFWSKWYKIVKQCGVFGLYGLPDFNHPKTKDVCEQVIKDYDQYLKLNSNISTYPFVIK